MNFPDWMECAGEKFGIILNTIFQRGLEFGLAGISIINGRAAFGTIEGKPLAPFLFSALSQLSKEPYIWAISLIGVGMIHCVVLLWTFNSEKPRARAVIAFAQTIAYVTVSIAILTGKQPDMAAERYIWNGSLAFLCFVVLLARAISDAQPPQGESPRG